MAVHVDCSGLTFSIATVIGHDFADPGVFYDRKTKTWYAFGTNGNGKNIQCSYSQDCCSWSHHEHDCLPGPLPAYQSGAGVSSLVIDPLMRFVADTLGVGLSVGSGSY